MRFDLRRYRKVHVDSPEEAQVVSVLGDAAIATVGIGHGRLIPLIIVDVTKRPDLIEVIAVQERFDDGDVKVQWGFLQNRPDSVVLFLQFQRPTKRTAAVEFSISRQGILVEYILQSHALYMQAGKTGDRAIHDLNRSKMLIEVPDTGFRAHWDKIYFAAIVKRMRKDGLDRRSAKDAARSYLHQLREFGQIRMK
jgi:hypothetical protein